MAYFRSFDVVVSALDNLETRRYVNRMCVAAEVPLVESGTTGFFGQVQPIRARHTECYDCTAHPTPTSYPVCTIRSTPSTPVHCIVWAKSWLFPQLFGAEEEVEADEQELDSAAQSGEDANELANLRAEARQMRTLRAALLDAARRGEADEAHAERLFNKLYDVDIRRLLSMEDMWRHRASRPAPLTLADARKAQGGSATHTLRDQQQLSVADTAALFLESLQALAARAVQSDAPIAFDKDDDEVLGFVTAAANLRAHVYHIPEKTRFETKQIAGNIIPAIATTNAVVSGLVVVQALHMLAQHWDRLRMVSIARRATRVFTTFPTGAPNPGCAVCHDVYVEVHADVERATLGDVLPAGRHALAGGRGRGAGHRAAAARRGAGRGPAARAAAEAAGARAAAQGGAGAGAEARGARRGRRSQAPRAGGRGAREARAAGGHRRGGDRARVGQTLRRMAHECRKPAKATRPAAQNP